MNLRYDQLETLDRDGLIKTARQLLVEADTLSSRITALYEIGLAMNRSLNVDAIQAAIASQAKWVLDFDHCSLLWLRGGPVRLVTLFGEVEPSPADWTTIPALVKASKQQQPVLIENGTDEPFLQRYASQILLPLTADDKVLGVIHFASTAPNRYTRNDLRIAYMFALQLASTIQNTYVLRELEETHHQLNLRVEELDAYTHTIAHDLKSPLTAILLRADIIERQFKRVLPETAHNEMAQMRESAWQMQRMIDQLLWLARLRNPEEAVTYVYPRPVIEAALKRFGPQIRERQIKIELAPNAPPILGHAQWVEEIFANFISNAIKYMGKDNPAPHILIRGIVQEQQVRYEVEDNGLGIRQEDQARLFEMFQRAHRDQADGLGLGLSIVKRIITRLNGKIGVESEWGRGSTFWFTLPMPPQSSDDSSEKS